MKSSGTLALHFARIFISIGAELAPHNSMCYKKYGCLAVSAGIVPLVPLVLTWRTLLARTRSLAPPPPAELLLLLLLLLMLLLMVVLLFVLCYHC